jgi:bifunctional non-homologous end joining protein LigD
VSTPVRWDEVRECQDARDERLLSFEVEEVLARTRDQGDLFAPVLSLKQVLPAT